jgi:cell shape-determining protein MreD
MKTLFLLLGLLTDSDAIRIVLHSCFTSAVVSVVVLIFAGSYQLIRRSLLRPNSATPSHALKCQESWEETKS